MLIIPEFYLKMSKLNEDIFYNVFKIFDELYYPILPCSFQFYWTYSKKDEEKEARDTMREIKKSFYSCLFVNKLWCKIIVPILWSDPWKWIP